MVFWLVTCSCLVTSKKRTWCQREKFDSIKIMMLSAEMQSDEHSKTTQTLKHELQISNWIFLVNPKLKGLTQHRRWNTNCRFRTKSFLWILSWKASNNTDAETQTVDCGLNFSCESWAKRPYPTQTLKHQLQISNWIFLVNPKLKGLKQHRHWNSNCRLRTESFLWFLSWKASNNTDAETPTADCGLNLSCESWAKRPQTTRMLKHQLQIVD